MSNTALMALIVFIPVVGAFVVPLAGMLSIRLRNWFALLLVSASFVLALVLLRSLMNGEIAIYRYPVPLGLNFVLYADKLAVFMAMVSSFRPLRTTIGIVGTWVRIFWNVSNP